MATPRTSAELKSVEGFRLLGASSLEFVVDPMWTVDDEPQLSFTSIFSLAECARELHWERDLDWLSAEEDLTAISRSVSGDFRQPIWVNSTLELALSVEDVQPTSYHVVVVFSSEGVRRAEVDIELVFTRLDISGRVEAPEHVRKLLRDLGAADQPDVVPS